jgi:hypothetical protein
MLDYKQLASLEARRKTGEIDRAELADFLWQAHIAQAILNAASSGPDERAKAMCHWVLLYRFAHSTRNETERAELESLAAKAGITRLSFYLHQFAIDFGTTILVSPNPVKKLDSLLNGPPKRGRKKHSSRENIEIAAAVEKLYVPGVVTFAEAYKSVASTLSKSRNITNDAVRIIHGRAMKDSATASAVRLVAAGRLVF